MICPYNPKVKACSNNSYDDCHYCQKNYLLISKKLERAENSTDELIEIFEWFKGRKLGSNEKERILAEIEMGNFKAIKEAYYPKY